DLPLDERRLLELLAVHKGSADLDDVLRADGGETDVLLPALDRLVAKGLAALEADTGRYRAATAGLERAVSESLRDSDALERHRSWWAVLSGRREEDPEKLRHAVAIGDAAYPGRAAPAVIEALRAGRQFEEA